MGFEVHRAARIAAAAHGGQVVVSSAARPALGRRRGCVDLGEHRFKDVDEPLAVFQVGAGELPAAEDALEYEPAAPGEPFVGREGELGEVLSRFDDGARLVTLTGPGGSGKTRLALEAAADARPGRHGGVFWVGLATLRDPALVLRRSARRWGRRASWPRSRPRERRAVLLVLLDNLEHGDRLRHPRSPSCFARVRISACWSRLASCCAWTVRPSTPVPPLSEPEAVALFCPNAHATESSAEISRAVRAARQPAARGRARCRPDTSVCLPGQILERVSERLDLLKGGRDTDPRQQTLRATIEWSYELLSEEEQRLFRGAVRLRRRLHAGCSRAGLPHRP